MCLVYSFLQLVSKYFSNDPVWFFLFYLDFLTFFFQLSLNEYDLPKTDD